MCLRKIRVIFTFFMLRDPVQTGASSQALSVFLERCEARGTIALAMIWADLTTSFSAVTVKSCLPSQRCHRWNCSCGRQVFFLCVVQRGLKCTADSSLDQGSDVGDCWRCDECGGEHGILRSISILVDAESLA